MITTMLAVYAFVLCTTLMGTTEATAVWKSAKKKNHPQQPKEAEHELGLQVGTDCSITQQASTGIYTLSATVGKRDGPVFGTTRADGTDRAHASVCGPI